MGEVTAAIVIGALGGWLAGMFGVGGGAVFVPALVFVLGREQHEAQGISLAAIVVTAIAATLVHRRQGHVDQRVVAWVTPLALVSGFAGGVLANQLPAEALQRIFALVLVAFSIRVLVQSFRTKANAPAPEPLLE